MDPGGAQDGTLRARTVDGSLVVAPREGRVIRFGRDPDQVNLCLGIDDLRVSRRQGELTFRERRWWLHNVGKPCIRLPDRELFTGEEPVPLPIGHTPMFVSGSGNREHLLEVHVTGQDGHRSSVKPGDTTREHSIWPLSDAERLTMIVLGQRYLMHERGAQPLPWRLVVEQLTELAPDTAWRIKKVEHLVGRVRSRLSDAGVAGLRRTEVSEPIGNTLNHNLIRELIRSGTVVPADLGRLDLDQF
jgi:hypothetical protein